MPHPKSPARGIRRMIEALTVSYSLVLEIVIHWPHDPSGCLRMILRPERPPSDKTLHFIAYAILALLLWACVRPRTAAPLRATGFVLAIIDVWAAVDEATQPFFYRAAGPLDWVYDNVGGMIGCIFAMLADRLVTSSGIKSLKSFTAQSLQQP